MELSQTSGQMGDSKRETSVEMPMSRINLSNKERLLLRKQALRMRKRPVLAVGILLGILVDIKLIVFHAGYVFIAVVIILHLANQG